MRAGQVILVGGFIETIELVQREGYLISGITDVELNETISKWADQMTYLGNDEAFLQSGYPSSFIIVGIDQPAVRRRVCETYEANGHLLLNLISHKANLAPSVIISENTGVFIQDFANVSANVQLGKGVRINTAANVMHDCMLGDYVTIAPNAVLLGQVHIGEGAYIGANATILPGITVGPNAIVGAGAVVTKDIAADTTVVGVPANVLKK